MVMPGNRSCNQTFKHRVQGKKAPVTGAKTPQPFLHPMSQALPRWVRGCECPPKRATKDKSKLNFSTNQSLRQPIHDLFEIVALQKGSMDVGGIPISSSCAICYLQCQCYCIRSFSVTLQTQLPHLLHCCRRAALVDDWILDPLLPCAGMTVWLLSPLLF